MIDFKNVRNPWNLPAYPPYHTGMYMEEYFYQYYINHKSHFDKTGYTLLPIFWTTAYLNQIDVTPYINALPKDKKWFCVAQHDDAVKETLPEGTMVFSAGGNSGGIPIPLVCSPIPTPIEPPEKDIFCSFVGSITHPVRQTMVNSLQNDNLFKIHTDEWKWHVNNERQLNFIDIMSRSVFTLCPRGYGAQSFRMYEALQLGSIPVYIHDDIKWLPYADLVDWHEFAVIFHSKNIGDVKDYLLSIGTEQRQRMIKRGRFVYEKIFSLQNLPERILKTLNETY